MHAHAYPRRHCSCNIACQTMYISCCRSFFWVDIDIKIVLRLYKPRLLGAQEIICGGFRKLELELLNKSGYRHYYKRTLPGERVPNANSFFHRVGSSLQQVCEPPRPATAPQRALAQLAVSPLEFSPGNSAHQQTAGTAAQRMMCGLAVVHGVSFALGDGASNLSHNDSAPESTMPDAAGRWPCTMDVHALGFSNS